MAGRQCWILYVDAVVLDASGNLLDALMLAVSAALAVTKIPRVHVVPGDTPDQFELQVTEETFVLDTSRVPLCLTLSEIGGHNVVDTTLCVLWR